MIDKSAVNEFDTEVLGRQARTLAEIAVGLLKSHGLKITFVESCTGGLLSKLITDVSGSSAVFECGIVSYSNRIKIGVLGVGQDTINRYTQVSEQTALEMARRACALSAADIGVSTTGASGPGGEANVQAGVSYFAICHGQYSTCTLLDVSEKKLSREQNRLYTAKCALKSICDYVEKISETGGNYE
ncbi:MAG: CinA family protein [Clostridia bacterium]|nr:CinA family protein [Clostridia bacterium]